MVHISKEGWLAQINTNLLGTISVTRAILPHFRQRRAGKIVFIGSKNGWKGGAGTAAYSVSKYALEGSKFCISSFCLTKKKSLT